MAATAKQAIATESASTTRSDARLKDPLDLVLNAFWTPTARTGDPIMTSGRAVVFFLTTSFLCRTLFGLGVTWARTFGFTVTARRVEGEAATGGRNV